MNEHHVLCDRCGHIRPGTFSLSLCNLCQSGAVVATRDDVIYTRWAVNHAA